MIHHTPDEPKATYPASAPIRGTLGNRPLVVETYSTRRALFSNKREYRWRVVHKSNHETMASGEGYRLQSDRDHAVDVLWPDLGIDALDR